MRPAVRPGLAALVLAVCALSTVAPRTASATSVVALDLDARLGRSADVFVATVTGVRGEPIGGEAWTVVTLRVERWLRSAGEDVVDPAPALTARPTVELAFLGGDAPGVPHQEVAGMPRLVEGERVLLLTYGAGTRYASNLVGFDQGLFRLVDEVWTDPHGARLSLDEAGVLTLGERGTPTGEPLLAAVAARLVQVGGP